MSPRVSQSRSAVLRRSGPLRTKSFAFAVRVVNLSRLLSDRDKEYVLSKQVLRSGTAVGALIREAQQAETRLDFAHKLGIALKEAEETQYWLPSPACWSPQGVEQQGPPGQR